MPMGVLPLSEWIWKKSGLRRDRSTGRRRGRESCGPDIKLIIKLKTTMNKIIKEIYKTKMFLLKIIADSEQKII